MAGVAPSVNDREWNLLWKIAKNSASIADAGGGSVAVEDGGFPVVSEANIFNFTGAGVTVTDAGGGQVNISIPGGGGGSYPEVANFSGLPAAAAHNGEIYVALATQGTRFVNRKPAGFYLSDGVNWILLAELEEDYFNTTYLRFFDPADPTKIAKWDISGFTAATTRTFVLPNANGTIALVGQAPTAHAASHQNGGSDEISVAGLSGLLADGQTPLAHATSHQNGGSDEISVAGLSGLLADGQTPLAHATSHQSGGSDAIKLDDLAAPDDNTDLNASTTAHGLVLKATAPAAGIRNVVAIDNAETAYKNTALFDTTNPAALGTAAPGTSLIAARRDHVHDRQTAITNAELAAAAKTGSIQFGKSNNGSALSTGVLDFAPEIPVGATITAWAISVDTGTATVKFWKKATGTAIPTIADVINTSGVAISSGTHVRSTTLTDFTTTTVSANDLFRCDLTAVSGATWINVTLEYTRT